MTGRLRCYLVSVVGPVLADHGTGSDIWTYGTISGRPCGHLGIGEHPGTSWIDIPGQELCKLPEREAPSLGPPGMSVVQTVIVLQSGRVTCLRAGGLRGPRGLRGSTGSHP